MSSITYDLFKEWKKSVRVRKIHGAYDELLNSARQNKRTPEEELRSRIPKEEPSFLRDQIKTLFNKEWSDFFSQCPSLKLGCWPSEFGELGSGVVLYFHFLAFLAGLLFLSLLCQIPAMHEYNMAGNIELWNYDPDGFTTGNIEACKCKGGQGHGAECGAWDLEECLEWDGGRFKTAELGQWCCQSWCYAAEADEKCPHTTDPDASTRSNRRDDLDFAKIRSYTQCEDQDKEKLKFCENNARLSQDIAFPGTGKDCPASDDPVYDGVGCRPNMIGNHFLTPGNLGPDRGDNKVIPLCYFANLILLCVAILIAHQYQIRVDIQVDAQTNQPNDFAIMVSGLPTTATDEALIEKFFSEHAVKGKDHTKIVKVIIGWDAQEFRQKMRTIRRLTKELQDIEPDDPRHQRMQDEIRNLKADLASGAADQAARLMASGVVVVVFQYKADMRACLARWTNWRARWSYKDQRGSCGLFAGDPLPLFPIGDRGVNRIHVARAPNPGDINWEDLGVPWSARWRMLLKTNGLMVLIVIATFFTCWGFGKLKEVGEKEGGADGNIISILPTVGISLANAISTFVAKKFGKREYHNTLTDQTFSQALKITAAIIVNTGGLLLFVYWQPRLWYEKGGLVRTILQVLALETLGQPLFFFVDFKYYLNGCCRRRHLSENLLAEWNELFGKGAPKTQEEAQEVARAQQKIQYYKAAYEPSELDMTRRYAIAVRTFIVCLCYSPLQPAALFIGGTGLTVQYWVDKYMLTKWYKRPTDFASAAQAMLSLVLVRYAAVLFFPLALGLFLHPSWKDKNEIIFWMLVGLAVAAGFCIIPLRVWRTIMCIRCLPGMSDVSLAKVAVEEDDTETDYYQAQYLWTKEMKYHKSQFIYKMLPEKKNPEFFQRDQKEDISLDDMRGGYSTAAKTAVDGTGQVRSGGLHLRGRGEVGADIPAAYGVTTPAAASTPAPALGVSTGAAPAGGAGAYGVSTGAAPAGGAGVYGVSAGAAPAGVYGVSAGAAPATSTAVYGVAAGATASPTPAYGVSAAAGDATPAYGVGAAPAYGVGVNPAPSAAPGFSEPAQPAVAASVPGGPVASHATGGAGTWEFELDHDHGWKPFDNDCQAFIESSFQKFSAGHGPPQKNVKTQGKIVSVDFGRMTQKLENSHKIRKIRRSD